MAEYLNLIETLVRAFEYPDGILTKQTILEAKLTQEITLTGSRIALHLSTDVMAPLGGNFFYEAEFDRDYRSREELEQEVQEGIEALRQHGYEKITYAIHSRLGPEHN